ncbi:hypothetical protein CL634_06575 [bacterium]|nr:hypothetical protein [bacterium]|tara:strand:+ start:187 stop:372 length:186 start_codon:yes stop_codon:yes gene_type:complete
MPVVKFPYTKEGEKNAKAAAKEYGGQYIAGPKAKKPEGMSVVIAVGSAKKPSTKRKRSKRA